MTERVLSGTGKRFAIATPHIAATAAGRAAFEAGGNAIDAALAAATTLSVVYPHMCGVGGDLFALVERPEGDVVAINSTGVSPRGIDPDVVRAEHGDAMPERGPFTVTVPGAVGGWWALHRRGAWLAWPDLFEAAPCTRAARRSRARWPTPSRPAWRRAFSTDPGLGAVFYPDGGPLPEGAVLVQPALQVTLAAIAAEGPDALSEARSAGGSRSVSETPGSRSTRRTSSDTRPRPCRRSSVATATSTSASLHPRPRASCCSRSSPRSSASRSIPTRSGPTPGRLRCCSEPRRSTGTITSRPPSTCAYTRTRSWTTATSRRSAMRSARADPCRRRLAHPAGRHGRPGDRRRRGLRGVPDPELGTRARRGDPGALDRHRGAGARQRVHARCRASERAGAAEAARSHAHAGDGAP